MAIEYFVKCLEVVLVAQNDEVCNVEYDDNAYIEQHYIYSVFSEIEHYINCFFVVALYNSQGGKPYQKIVPFSFDRNVSIEKSDYNKVLKDNGKTIIVKLFVDDENDMERSNFREKYKPKICNTYRVKTKLIMNDFSTKPKHGEYSTFDIDEKIREKYEKIK